MPSWATNAEMPNKLSFSLRRAVSPFAGPAGPCHMSPLDHSRQASLRRALADGRCRSSTPTTPLDHVRQDALGNVQPDTCALIERLSCSAKIVDNPSRHRLPAIGFPERGNFSVERSLGFAVAAESHRPVIGAEHERICSNVRGLGPLIRGRWCSPPLTKPDVWSDPSMRWNIADPPPLQSRARLMAARRPPGAPQHHRLRWRAPHRPPIASDADPRSRIGGNKKDESAPPAVFRRWRRVSFGQRNSCAESRVRLSRPREGTSEAATVFVQYNVPEWAYRRLWAPSCPQTGKSRK